MGLGEWVGEGDGVGVGDGLGVGDRIGAGHSASRIPFTECAQTDTQTHRSENHISASFTPFTWRI